MTNHQKLLSQVSVMTKVSSIKDKKTLNLLLKTGEVFNPMEGWVLVTNSTSPSIWQQKISHGGKGELYEYLLFQDIPEQYTKILKECREAGFGQSVPQSDGFTYKIISGGIMRRKIKKQEK